MEQYESGFRAVFVGYIRCCVDVSGFDENY